MRDVEVVSFVSPTAVPAMASPTEVLDALGTPFDATRWALVPNVRGAELALGAGVDHLTVTLSASEGYSIKNTKMSTDEALEQLAALRALAEGAVVDAVVSCCFGSPFEPIDPGSVAELVATIRSLGVDQVTLADTTGTATPARVEAVLDGTGTEVGVHLHDTRGTALTNAYAAYLAGVRRFDTALGGLGGSPFAPGAGGNLATEDLVAVLEDLGVSTGIDLAGLLETGRWLAGELDLVLPSRMAAAGPLDPRS